MEKRIEINNRTIPYTHKINARSRRIRITVYPGGQIVVATPKMMSDVQIYDFIRKKAKWIIGKYDLLKQYKKPESNKAEYLEYKKQALDLAKSRLEFFNKHYGFKYNKVSIKNHRSLWGSCSKRSNLNFNYKIALISPEQADYIIVHELCHLGEFNHSQKFWNLVALSVPNYKTIKKQLKQSHLKFF